MKYEDKDRKQLINELEKLHQRITELEKSEIEHEKVQESFKRLNYQNKLILESVGEGIYGVDLEGNVTFFNPSAENITGYNAEEVIGKYQHTILHHTKKDGSPYPAEECPVYTTLVDGISRHITDEIFWRKDGTSFPVEYTSAPIKDRGNIIGVVVIFHDVTERKKAEKDIKDSETKYKSIFENTGTATVIVEEDTTISLVNTEFEKLSGYSKEEIEGKKSWTEFVVEDDLDRLKEYHRLRRIDPESAPRNYEFKFIDRHGNVKDVFLTISMIPETRKSLGSLLNVTESKKVEKALRESEEKLRTIFESSPDAITLFDLEANIIDCNQATVKLHGFSSREELIGMNAFDLIAPQDRQSAAEAMKIMLERGSAKNMEYTFLTKDGQEFPAEGSGAVIVDGTGKPISFVSITQNISERKKYEQTLYESQKKLKIAMDLAKLVNWEYDVESDMFTFNDRFYALYGTTAQEEGGYQMPSKVYATKFIPPEESPIVAKEIADALATDDPNYFRTLEHRIIRADGEERFIVVRFGIIKDAEGRTIKTYGANQDITERKMMEDALKASEERIQGIFESSPDTIGVMDLAAKMVECNQAALDMFGFSSKDELIGKRVFEFIAPEYWQEAAEAMKMTVEKGHITHFESILMTKDGREFPAEISSSVSLDPSGKPSYLVAIIKDITERKHAEEQIQKSLEEKEMFLKEIHHRVKNNLMVISSLLNLQSRYIKDKEALSIFTESQSRAKSMALIHEKLYRSTDLKRINFGEYIRTLATDLFYTYVADPSRIKLNMDVEDIMLDINTAIPLGLIVNELVSNCMKHAFPGGRSGEIGVDFHREDGEFALIVSDNGMGFPEDLDFQNTDTLGLQLVNSLTSQIDGTINLDKTAGTTFKIKFVEEEYE